MSFLHPWSVVHVYTSSQLSLNKYVELLFLAEQKSDSCLLWCFPHLWAACWHCRGRTVWGVICFKHFITAPHKPSLSLAAYMFSMKGPVHACGNLNYL